MGAPFLMPYVFRVVKQARYVPPPHTVDAQFAAETHAPRLVTFSNEYVVDMLEGRVNMTNYVCDCLVLAEQALVSCDVLCVSVFDVPIGEKINFETPVTVYNPCRVWVVNGSRVVYPVTRVHPDSERLLHFGEPLEYQPTTNPQQSFGIRAPSEWMPGDMFFAVRTEFTTKSGNGRRNIYLNSVQPYDTYTKEKGIVCKHSNAYSLDKRWKRFRAYMQLVKPFLSSCYTDKDGIMRQGEPVDEGPYLCSISDMKQLRRAEIAKREAQYAFSKLLAQRMFEYRTVYKTAEAVSCGNSHNVYTLELYPQQFASIMQLQQKIVNEFIVMFGGETPEHVNPNRYDFLGDTSYYPVGGLDYSSPEIQGIISRINEFYLACILQLPFNEVTPKGTLWLTYPTYDILTNTHGSFVGFQWFVNNNPDFGVPATIGTYARDYYEGNKEWILKNIANYFPLYENLTGFYNLLGMCEKIIRPKQGPKVIISDIQYRNRMPFKEDGKFDGGAQSQPNTTSAVYYTKQDADMYTNTLFANLGVPRDVPRFVPLDYCREGFNFEVPKQEDRRRATIRTGTRDLKPAAQCGHRIEAEIPLLAGGSKSVTIEEKNGFLDRAILKIYRYYNCQEGQPPQLQRGFAAETKPRAVKVVEAIFGVEED